MICKDKYESERFVLSHTTYAVLMGGYLRDLILDRPWKDIDLFVCVSDTDMLHHRTSGCYLLDWQHDCGGTVETEWYIISDVKYDSDFAVFACRTVPGVQLILYTKHYNTLDTQYEMALSYMNYKFPCTLSKVCMTLSIPRSDRWFCMSSAFEWAVRNQELEFSAGCPQEYRDRMASYFPDYTAKPPLIPHF